MGDCSYPSSTTTTSHPLRRKAHRPPLPPPVYSRDFAYPNSEYLLVPPGPRMARPSIRDASASHFAEYVLSFFRSNLSPTTLSSVARVSAHAKPLSP
jgi:hypothetical protein